MSDENKAIVRRLIEDLWTKGNLSVADELFSENYTHHDPSTPDFGQGRYVECARTVSSLS